MDARVEAAIGFMHESLSHQTSIAILSKNVNLAPTRLRQLFRRETGRSPMKYLQDLRMQHAEYLLRNTFLTVKEVAFATGAKHVSSVVHAFKKRHGLAPGEFRARKGPISGHRHRGSHGRRLEQ